MNWDEYFMTMANAASLKSKDTTKVGCVIVGPSKEIRSTGWNGFSRGVTQCPSREERPAKYDWTCHAEANAVYNAARFGAALEGSTAYCTHHPCKNCADALIQAGIKTVIFGGGEVVGDHGFDIAKAKLQEAGVNVHSFPGRT